jgi:hypothetical protein
MYLKMIIFMFTYARDHEKSPGKMGIQRIPIFPESGGANAGSRGRWVLGSRDKPQIQPLPPDSRKWPLSRAREKKFSRRHNYGAPNAGISRAQICGIKWRQFSRPIMAAPSRGRTQSPPIQPLDPAPHQAPIISRDSMGPHNPITRPPTFFYL